MKNAKKDKVTVVCYGNESQHDRNQALSFYKQGVRECEGAERERYENIVIGLEDGWNWVCDDGRYRLVDENGNVLRDSEKEMEELIRKGRI